MCALPNSGLPKQSISSCTDPRGAHQVPGTAAAPRGAAHPSDFDPLGLEAPLGPPTRSTGEARINGGHEREGEQVRW